MHMQQVKASSLFLNYSTFDLVRTKMHLYRELRGLEVHALYAEFEESASLNVSFNQNMEDETLEEEQLSLSKNFKESAMTCREYLTQIKDLTYLCENHQILEETGPNYLITFLLISGKNLRLRMGFYWGKR